MGNSLYVKSVTDHSTERIVMQDIKPHMFPLEPDESARATLIIVRIDPQYSYNEPQSIHGPQYSYYMSIEPQSSHEPQYRYNMSIEPHK